MTQQQEMTAAKRAAGVHFANRIATKVEADWLRHLADMPDDTRGLTERVCGDPLPGRSALDRRQA
jgi:hypothetical protein